MATAFDRTVQALADVSGIIVDRSVTPEKVIGQAWIISKSRMVVLASSVANYADAPWALLVKFPYPDLVFSVKTVSIHPEFNKRAARDYYLAQANELLPQAPVMEYDIATITIEAEIPDLQPDRVHELNRALSLPLSISAQDLSGVMRVGDTGDILQKALTSQRNGVLNLYDERKIPFCRVLIRSGHILKAVFQNLQNEFAICELMWRKPGGNFVLQSLDSLNWGLIPEIGMATDQLGAEAKRRTQDLPRLLDALGGPEARYVRSRQQIDLNQINQQIRWVAERIWPALDGGLPLNRMSERLAIDTYTALQALWEMKHLGFVAMANVEQFHRSKQIGPALNPGHEIDLKFWDSLQGFFLDDLSMLPVTIQGNYFGPTHLQVPCTMLHSMQIQCKYGAIVLKDGRLVGLHNGKFTANLQNPPPFPLSRMTWVGALNDMSAKRMRSTAAELEAEGAEDSPTIVSGLSTVSGQKTRTSSTGAIESGVPVASDQPSSTPPLLSDEPEILQKFNKKQMGFGGGMIGFLLGLMFAAMITPKTTVVPPKPAPATSVSATSTNTGSASSTATGTGTDQSSQKQQPSGEVFKSSLKIADFKNTPIGQFQFTDTSKDTAPKPSFGLESESSNQKIYFVVWPNAITTEAVDSNVTLPPYVPLKVYPEGLMKLPNVAQGTSPLRNFCWKVKRYLNSDKKDTLALVGAFSSTQQDKSILVVAMPFKGEGDLDFKNTVNVIERMFNEAGTASSGSAGPSSGMASEADIQAYRKKIGDIIKPLYKSPPDADGANKCVVIFVVDSGGNISKLDTKYSSGIEEVDKAVQKAISAKVPYPAPPNTKSGQVPMQVTLEGGELTIDEP